MTVPSTSARKTPWLAIILGVIAVLCLCTIVIVLAVLAFLTPLRTSSVQTTVTEVFSGQETALPTSVPTQATSDSTNSIAPEAAAAGTAVDIGNNMTLTVLDATRPADELVADGSSFNTTAPEGEEFMRVDVEVTCNSEPGTPCTFYPTVIKAVLSDGSTRDLQTFIEGVEDWDTSLETEGGETQQGFLLFLVPKSESDVLLSYQDIYDDHPVYLQLP